MTAPHGRWGTPVRLGRVAAERYGSGVRWLRVGRREVVRAIALVVRDRDWRTPDPLRLRIDRRDGALTLRGVTAVGAGELAWSFRVAATAGGLDAHARLTALGDVDVNRAGLVVLLPCATCAGARFAVRHRAGGRTSRGRLPVDVAPHQPLLDVATLELATRDGTKLSLAFDGDTFEMEDQRNWLDPTFKLYNRELALPVPYRIADGATVEQRVALRVDHVGRGAAPRPGPRRGRVPALGVATAPGRVPEGAAARACAALGASGVTHRADGTAADAARAGAFARAIGAGLTVEAIGAAAGHAPAFAAQAPARIALYGVGDEAAQALVRDLRDATAAGGTFSDFVMLNRNGVPAWARRATFALCPTVHARDDRSLVETLAALDDVFARARRVAGGRPIDAGPCSLRRRLVPRTGLPAPDDVDPRQHEAIAAAWLACAIAVAGARRIDTFCAFEAAGARGLLADGTPLRATRASSVFAALASAQGRPLVLLGLDPARGAAFVVDGTLWLVELSGRARRLGTSRPALHLAATRWASRRVGQPVAGYGIATLPAGSAIAGWTERLAAAWTGA
ncbi:MAG: hypothetical protein BroJett026_16430 [Betaproteobacteria bacterium]|nr:MAG: hypothetical protein BroJett026_16430 [Betaproteobacteria bacterium]